jgi:hypothetical protein
MRARLAMLALACAALTAAAVLLAPVPRGPRAVPPSPAFSGLGRLLEAPPALADEPSPAAETVQPSPAGGLSAPGPARATRGRPAPWPLAPFLLLALFGVMILLPFLPGLLEIYRPRDEYPLPIATGYAKDPHYLGDSARRLVAAGLGARQDVVGVHEITMSRPEKVEVHPPQMLPADQRINRVLRVTGDLLAGPGCRFAREVFVAGTAQLGPSSRLRALATDGDALLGHGSVVERWVDVRGGLTVEFGCRLGAHCSTTGPLQLADGVVFQRLFGHPVRTEEPTGAPASSSRPTADPDASPGAGDAAAHARRGGRRTGGAPRRIAGGLRIPAGKRLAEDLFVLGDLDLATGAHLAGSVRVSGKARLGRRAVIDGSLFAEGAVELGPGAQVTGHLFTQDRVACLAGAQVGLAGTVKSVIGKRSIRLAEGVVVHGYLLTEGEGRVACGVSS